MTIGIPLISIGEKYFCETKVGLQLYFDGQKNESFTKIVSGKFIIDTYLNNTGINFVKSIKDGETYHICNSKIIINKKNNKVEFTDAFYSSSMEGVFSCRSSKKIGHGGYTMTEFIFETEKKIFTLYNNFLERGKFNIEKGSCLEI